MNPNQYICNVEQLVFAHTMNYHRIVFPLPATAYSGYLPSFDIFVLYWDIYMILFEDRAPDIMVSDYEVVHGDVVKKGEVRISISSDSLKVLFK